MKYKVGDILLCKKNYHKDFFYSSCYKVMSPASNLTVFGRDVYIKGEEIGWWFTMDKKRNNILGSLPYLWDYFFTLKELRQFKLKQLDEI